LETDDGTWRVRGIEDARGALGRLRRALGDEPLEPEGPLDQGTVDRFVAAMDADFNTPDALAAIFDLARETNTLRTASKDTSAQPRPRVRLPDVRAIDLRAQPTPADHHAVEPYVDLLVEVRRKLRDVKQWALADEIRTSLADLGVTIQDRPGGDSS